MAALSPLPGPRWARQPPWPQPRGWALSCQPRSEVPSSGWWWVGWAPRVALVCVSVPTCTLLRVLPCAPGLMHGLARAASSSHSSAILPSNPAGSSSATEASMVGKGGRQAVVRQRACEGQVASSALPLILPPPIPTAGCGWPLTRGNWASSWDSSALAYPCESCYGEVLMLVPEPAGELPALLAPWPGRKLKGSRYT